MDAPGLQAALQASRAQLQQVERALGAADPAERADLLRLRADLQELTALTEAALTEAGLGEAGQTDTELAEPGQTQAAVTEPGRGAKVSAPFPGTGGLPEYHNAMVVSAEAACVRVLCLCPTRAALRPCPFYLENRCRFQDKCR